MKDQVYTLSTGNKIYILDEIDLNSRKFVMFAGVDPETKNLSEEIGALEYIASTNEFAAISDKVLLTEVVKIFSAQQN